MALVPKEIYCETWPELHKAIDDFSGADPYHWLFRGHRNASWQLRPRIERGCDLGTTLTETEGHLFTEFRSKAHLYTEHLPPLEDTLSWMGVMQHYGIPTRLLDWSYSAYVALFFAFETAGEEECGALWAIHADPLMKIARHLTEWSWFRLTPGAILETPHWFGCITSPSGFDKHESTGLIVSLLPRFHASRLSSQQSCFLLNCNYFMTFENSLAEMMSSEGSSWLYRIIFPQRLRIECLRRLMSFNIHHASLFPDLDGLGKFLALKIELFPTLKSIS